MRTSLIMVILMVSFFGVILSHAEDKKASFSLKDETGKIYTQEEFKGKELVLFVFTFECPHCRRAMPFVQDMSKEGHAVLGIAYSTHPQDLAGKRKKAGLTFPIAIGTKKFNMDYGIRGVPTLFRIASDGTIMERFSGSKGAKRLKESLAEKRQVQ